MLKSKYTLLPLLILIAFISGCTSQLKPHVLELPKKQPLVGIHEPNNSVLMSAIEDYIKLRLAPAYTRFEYARIDLNKDGRRDAIVMLKSPHNFWCHEFGCRVVIFKANNENFGLLSEMNLVRGPLLISEQTTNSWRDIIIREDGRGARARYVAMRHNGISYPPNSQYEQTFHNINNFSGTRILP